MRCLWKLMTMDIQLMSVQELQANQKACYQLMEVGVRMLGEGGNQPQVNTELIGFECKGFRLINSLR